MSIDLTNGAHRTGLRPSIYDLRLAYRWAQGQASAPDVLLGAEVVTVLSAHGGAGASTLALALAEAVAATRSVRLLDVAEPVRSGLVCATTTELGPDGSGWLLGMRGPVQIDRRDPAHPSDPVDAAVAAAPVPRTPDPGQVVIVDQGSQHLGRWEAAARHGGQLVVVAGSSTPSLRTAALLLATHPEPVLVVVGARRLVRRLLRGSPTLTALDADGRVVVTPTTEQLAVDGITAAPLGRSLAATGALLLRLLGQDSPPPSTTPPPTDDLGDPR